ncbi:hypothetical protein [Candidatus Palauibacter sp.]|uniref:hypothetical protein n=1 Tax=Candidatus Palauibacter sp. TaxID=3101350 RepID=UPI003AF1F075
MPDRGLRRPFLSVVLSLVPLCVATPGTSQEWRDFRAARQAGDLEAVDVHLLYPGGRLSVSPSETPLLYDARLHYDAADWAPRRTWRREGGTGQFRFTVSSLADGQGEVEASIRLDPGDLGFDLEDLPRDAGDTGRLSLALHPSVPIRLKLGVGAGRARLQLGGLALTAFEFATGASDARLSFARENRVPMELLSIKSGATGFAGEHLGNARFERLEFYGIVGDVVLDFSGVWRSSAEAEIKIVLGELVMRVPSNIGVRVRRSGLGSFSAEDLQKVGEDWVSPNWEGARVQLDITVTAGLGSVTVERS